MNLNSVLTQNHILRGKSNAAAQKLVDHFQLAASIAKRTFPPAVARQITVTIPNVFPKSDQTDQEMAKGILPFLRKYAVLPEERLNCHALNASKNLLSIFLREAVKSGQKINTIN